MISDTKNRRLHTGIFATVIFSVFIAWAFVLPVQAGGSCAEKIRQLRADYEMIQQNGGLWGYMEQAASLKKNSTLGFQLDAKLQRAVVAFESSCNGNPPGKPQLSLFDRIQQRFGEARAIKNGAHGRTSIKKIQLSLNNLNNNLDQLLKEL
jgi:hypothetical protein